MKKEWIILLLGVFLLSFATALGPYEKNTELNITVTCLNNGYCSAAAYCNINVQSPTGQLVLQNQNMTNLIYVHSQNFTPEVSGDYQVSGFCNDGDLTGSVEFPFSVSNSGKESSTSESILYSLLTFVFFGLLLVMIYFIIVTPYKNERNENGLVLSINKLKYLKVLLITFTYPVLIILLNLMNGLSQNFVDLTIFGGIIGFLFEALLSFAWIFTIVMILWIIYLLIRDSNFSKLIRIPKVI